MGARRSVRVFLNEDSGPGNLAPDDVCATFAAHGCDCEVTMLGRSARRGPDWLNLEARDAAEVVWVAAGGDGTVNAIAARCAKSGRTMGVIPAGTLNHFARDLGLPPQVEEAVAAIAAGAVRMVDAAEANGCLFVNNSSLGMYAAMVLDRDRMRKDGGSKWWAMVKASARAFWRFRCMQIEFLAEGQPRRCTTALLFVGNNRYEKAGGRIGCRNRLDEGILSVALIAGGTRWGTLKVFLAALLGRAESAGALEEFIVQSFEVKAHGRRRLRVAFDGEVKRVRGPLVYRVLPGALRVIAPAVAPEEEAE